MKQKLIWMPVKPQNMGHRAEVEYSGPKPTHLWTLFMETDEDKKPRLPIVPVHLKNAFIEDFVHDYNIRGGKLHYYSRVTDRPLWILLESEE
jgi:hypothetical protein